MFLIFLHSVDSRILTFRWFLVFVMTGVSEFGSFVRYSTYGLYTDLFTLYSINVHFEFNNYYFLVSYTVQCFHLTRFIQCKLVRSLNFSISNLTWIIVFLKIRTNIEFLARKIIFFCRNKIKSWNLKIIMKSVIMRKEEFIEFKFSQFYAIDTWEFTLSK